MPRLLSCPRGHQWHDATDSAAALCPVCGLAVAPAAAPSAAHPPVDTAPTLLEPPSWRPFGQGPAPHVEGFEILEEIGHGGMGVVYKARPQGSARPVALKLIRKDRLQHEEAVRRFRREAQAAARLDHPNIVQVLDSDHTGDTHYLVMEFVDGITLERLVEQAGPLLVGRACDFIRQAALGLQHAHEQALVHRDIKPANLMVTPAPAARAAATEDYQVKVLDMGVARVLQLGGATAGESLSTLTQGGSVIGTADYVAPEQLEDPHGADIRADLYSLGCTFYYLLTGRVPFPGGSLVSKLDKQRWQTATPIGELRPEVPAAVTRVVSRLMAKRPADRFATPGVLAEALEALARTGYAGAAQPGLRLVETQRLSGHRGAVWAVRCAPEGRLLASAGKDGQVLLWDLASATVVRHCPPQTQEVRALAFAPGGARLASAGGLTPRVWDVETLRELRRLGGHTGAIKCLGFSADGAWLFSGGDDKTVRAWDLQGGGAVLRLARHRAAVTCLAVLPEAQQLVTGSRDQTLRLWELRNGQEVRVLQADGGAVHDVALAPDGRHAASAHFDTIVRLWDLPSGRAVRRFVGHKQMVSAVAFTPDGRRLLSVSHDHTLRLWDVASGEELGSTRGHEGGITALAVHPDGTRAITAGADGTICVVELPP